MKVLVNALPLRFGGGVTYLRHQLQAMTELSPEWSFHTLVAPWTEGLSELPGEVETVPLRSVAARSLYEQVGLPRRRADLVYCPANFGPLWHRDPVVLTVHNPNYYGTGLELPDTKESRPLAKVKANHWAMRRADAVVAISESMAAEIATTLPGLERLSVITSGAPDWPDTSEPVPGLPERYVMVMGSFAPHKRVPETVRGWARSVDLDPEGAADLVVVGPLKDAVAAACRTAAGRHLDRVTFTGQVNGRPQLRWIYEHALALVSNSVLEAFPLTPGEAGAVGCPTVLSDIPPHREVTCGHGRFFPPGDVEAQARLLVTEVYPGRLDRTTWHWPRTWQDNAEAFAALFRDTAARVAS